MQEKVIWSCVSRTRGRAVTGETFENSKVDMRIKDRAEAAHRWRTVSLSNVVDRRDDQREGNAIEEGQMKMVAENELP